MTITICIGSSCHLKGSREVVEQIRALVAEHGLQDRVMLKGTFCVGNCCNGVSVLVDDTLHSVSPDTARTFFETQVLRSTPERAQREVCST